jgi:hypothetical protein
MMPLIMLLGEEQVTTWERMFVLAFSTFEI